MTVLLSSDLKFGSRPRLWWKRTRRLQGELKGMSRRLRRTELATKRQHVAFHFNSLQMLHVSRTLDA